MDYSKMSDSELEKIANEPNPFDFTTMSDAELERIASGGAIGGHKEGGGLLGLASKVVDKIDSVTGAPVRASIGAFQDGKNPISAYSNQFGADPSLAPTGKDIAIKAGVQNKNNENILPEDFYSEDEAFKTGFPSTSYGMAESARKVSPAGVAGFGIDIAADPTNLIGIPAVSRGINIVGGASKDALRMAKAGAKTAVKATPFIGPTFNVAEKVVDTSADTARALKKLFTPTVSKDFNELKNIAVKNGIDPSLLPESVEFGENSFISRASRNRNEGILGQDHLNKFKHAYESVQDAAENKIQSFANGSVPTSIEAGEIIRDGFDKGVDNFFNSIGMTHNKVMDAIPGLTLSPEAVQKIESKLNGLEKWAKGRSTRGFTNAQRAQGEQLIRAIDAVKSGNGSYKQAVEALRDIGDVAFKSKNVFADVPPDIEKFRDLYFTLDDALIDTVEKSAGAPVANELRESNKAISEFLGDKSVISSVIGNKNISPERVFETLVQNGDTKKIESLRKILPPAYFDKLKGAFLNSQIRKNADDIFSFKALHSNLQNKKNVLGALLSPQEISEFGDIVRLGDSFGSPVLSTSGTGASNAIRDIAQGLSSAVQNDSVIDLLKESARKRSALPIKGSAATEAVSKGPSGNTLSSLAKDGEKLLTAKSSFAMSIPLKANSIQNQNAKKDVNRGPEKWASDGFQQLFIHAIQSGKDPIPKSLLYSDQKTKNLLIQASDLKPGTPAMKKIFEKISSSQNGGQ